MQHLEVSGAVRHIYIYIYVIRRLKVKMCCQVSIIYYQIFCHTINIIHYIFSTFPVLVFDHESTNGS